MNLSWNEFKNSTTKTFNKLHENEVFSDVTLACGEGKQIKAHRVILSSCSPFFQEVLIQNPHHHPLLYLKGVNIEDLRYLMKFIYTGEVEIPNEGLAKFLDSANYLQISGLLQKDSNNQNKADERKTSAEKDMFSKNPPHIRLESMENMDQNDQTTQDDQDVQDDQDAQDYLDDRDDQNDQRKDLKSEEDTPGINVNDHTVLQTDYKELNKKIDAIMEKVHGVWTCLACGKKAKDQSRLTIHIEGLHIEGFSHPCKVCGGMFSTRNSVAKHIRKRICKQR